MLFQFPSMSAAILSALAAVNFVSAFIVLYMMQTVTGQMGVRSKLALLYLVQRVIYLFLVYALFTNAVHIYFDGIMPARSDAMVETAFFLSCVISFLRHRLAPSLPVSDAARRWSAPIMRSHY
jgi:hypothetical protein